MAHALPSPALISRGGLPPTAHASPGSLAAARASEFVIYPDSPHAFHADYRPTYRAGPAQDGFKRALEWFKAKGVS